MLNKVKVINLKEIYNPAGSVIKYLDKKNKNFLSFGEIYFSEIKKGYEKGWNLHKKYKSIITVPYGKVEFCCMNLSKTKRRIFKIGRKKPSLIIIPPQVWFKFKSLSKISVIVNTINDIHKKNETLKFPL